MNIEGGHVSNENVVGLLFFFSSKEPFVMLSRVFVQRTIPKIIHRHLSYHSDKTWQVYLSGEYARTSHHNCVRSACDKAYMRSVQLVRLDILCCGSSIGAYTACCAAQQFSWCHSHIVLNPGEIHSDWREQIAQGIQEHKLPVVLSSPITSHEDSDDCGAIILGMEEERPNWDKIGASMNNIRTKTLIQQADVVVVRFGEKYRQWNAAFDAGFAAALGKPIITLHPPAVSHMLKEVNASASAVCEEPEQVVQTFAYAITGALPSPRDGDAYVPIADRLGNGNPNP